MTIIQMAKSQPDSGPISVSSSWPFCGAEHKSATVSTCGSFQQ